MLNKFKRGSVYWYDFGHHEDNLQGGKRPCIIISNDKGNMFGPTVQVLPLTTQKDNLPFHRHLILNGTDNYTCVEQITTVCKNKLFSYLGILQESDMKIVNDAIREQFSLLQNEDELLLVQLDKVNELLENINRIKSEELSNKISVSKQLNNSIEKLSNEIKTIKTGTGNRKYSGMTAVEKFNAKYNINTEENKKQRKKKRNWTEEDKKNLIKQYDDCPKQDREKLINDWELTDIKMLQTYVAKFRKELYGTK